MKVGARHGSARRPDCSGCVAEEVLVASTGVIGVSLPIEKISSGLPRRDRGARSESGRRGGARHHDHRSVPERGGGAHGRPGQRDRDRRDGQRLGHDRADDGDDAGVRDDRCGGAPRHCSIARCARRSNDTFNAITVDGECSTNDCVMILANGASGVTIDESTYFALRRRAHRRLSRAGARHRSRRRRRDQARDGQGHRRGVRRGGAAGGEGDRQLAARQDGGPRRRSELGPAHRGGRTRQRRVRAVARGSHDRIDCVVSRRNRRTTRRRRSRPNT